VIHDVKLSDGALYTARFSSDSRRVVTTGDDHAVRITDVATGLPISAITSASAERGVFAAGAVVGGGADGTLQAWTPLEVKLPRSRATVAPFTFPSFSRRGLRVASGDFGGAVHVWDVGGREHTAPGDDEYSVVTAMSLDGSHVASAGSSPDGPVRLFDVKADTSRKLAFPKFPKYAIAMSATGRIAVAGDADASGAYPIVIQNADGTNALRLAGHTDLVDALAFDSDGTHLVSGSWDGTARIWDLKTRTSRKIDADAQVVRWVAFSDDDTRMVTAGADGTVRIWPVGGGGPTVLVGHEGPVNTAAFNHRGDRIVSTGMDGTVRIWDAAGGDTLVVLVRHTGADGGGAAFSADDRYVVSSGKDGMRVTRCEVCDSFAAVERLARTRAARRLDASERERLADG
jgi:WD40 repeat protein